jgi:hypothetical protein
VAAAEAAHTRMGLALMDAELAEAAVVNVLDLVFR